MNFDKMFDYFEKHHTLILTILWPLLFSASFLLYTLDRSFLVHQKTLLRILQWNEREGLYCSKAHVGHDGTTLEFMTIPKEVGTAGTIEPAASLPPVDYEWAIPLEPMVSYFSFIFGISLVFLLLSYFVKRKNKEEKPG